MYTCAECRKESCVSGDDESRPHNCPSRDPGCSAVLAAYHEDVAGNLARSAARVEGHGYCRLTRVEEIMDFARRCGFSHLGLAFCVGLHAEAAVVSRIFRANGFAVDSVACKNGALPKEEIGLTDEDKIVLGDLETMCNPIGQARALARAGTQLNVVRALRGSRQPVHDALRGPGHRAGRQGPGVGPQPACGGLPGRRLLLRQVAPQGRLAAGRAGRRRVRNYGRAGDSPRRASPTRACARLGS